jgi:hypothetical protein
MGQPLFSAITIDGTELHSGETQSDHGFAAFATSGISIW